MLVCPQQSGRKSPRSNMVAPNAALSSTARWGAALEISVSRNTAVSSVEKTTLGTVTTEQPPLGGLRLLAQFWA